METNLNQQPPFPPQGQPPNDGTPAPPNNGSGLAAAVNKLGDVTAVERILEELKLQTTIYETIDGDECAALERSMLEKVLGCGQLICFATLVKGKLRVLHSLQKFSGNLHSDSEFDNCIIGWLGDRKPDSDPQVVILNDDCLEWDSVDDIVLSETQYRIFYDTQGNRAKFYSTAEDDTVGTKYLPKLLLIPSGHVEWLSKEPRTAWEYHEKLLQDVGGDVDNRPDQLKLSLMWLKNVSMAGGNENVSRVTSLPMEYAFPQDDAAFMAWVQGRINTTLGQVVSLPPAVVTNYYMPPQAPPTASTTTGVSSSSASDKEFPPMHTSAIQGWCHTLSDQAIPEGWQKFYSNTDATEMRKTFMKMWDDARKEMVIDIGETCEFFIDDYTLKEWKKINLSPGGPTPVLEYLMRGMSMLLFMNVSAEAVLRKQDRETQYQETANTRTADQVSRRLRSEPSRPPQDWNDLKYVLNTYAIGLRALFTMDCDHYIGVWELRNAVVSLRQRKEKFTGKICALITWWVLKDSIQFFAQALMPESFENIRSEEQIAWPRSVLFSITENILGLRFQSIETVDFPARWEDQTPKREQQDQDGRRTGGPRDWRNSGGQREEGSSRSHGRSHIRHDEGANKILFKMGSVVEDVKNSGDGWVWYLSLINTGGLDPSTLPSLQGYKDSSGKSTLCTCGLMGLCKYDTNKCKFVCPDARDITDEFVDKYVQVMKPVMEQYLRKKRDGTRRR